MVSIYIRDILVYKRQSVRCLLNNNFLRSCILDLNECLLGTFQCNSSQICSNTAGSYECSCATNLIFEDGECRGRHCSFIQYVIKLPDSCRCFTWHCVQICEAHKFVMYSDESTTDLFSCPRDLTQDPLYNFMQQS